MELVDKDFKEKVKKNNVLRPHGLWFGLSSPPCNATIRKALPDTYSKAQKS